MHFRHLLAGLGALVLLAAGHATAGIPSNISNTVGVCNPLWPQQCIQAGPFTPDALSTVTLAVTSTSGRVALTGTGGTVLVNNTGSVAFYVKLGGSTVSAAATDFYVPAGAQIPLARGTNTYIAAKTASSTSTLVASTGNGTAAGGSGGGSGGGGGGAVTVADGADVTQGAIGDTAWSGSGNGTIDAILKAVALNTTGNATLTSDTHAQCAALCSSLVVKASAGTLKTFEVSADSTLSGAIWYVIVFDATSLPANGAITPTKCYQQASGTTQMGGTLGPGGTAYLTGITIGVSTTGCFTQTASVHAFIAGDFQ